VTRHRLRHLLVALLGGAALAAGLLLALPALPSRAQAAVAGPAPLGAPALNPNQPGLALPGAVPVTYTLYLPLIEVPPCTLAPLLLTPTHGSLVNSLIPVLTFLRQSNAVLGSYVYVTTDPAFHSFAAIVPTSGGGPGPVTVNLFHNLQPGTTYYWHALDYCSFGFSPYSSVFTFTAGSGGVILPGPALVSPASGTVGVGAQVTLTWNAVGGASGYQLWLSQPDGSNRSYLVTTTSKVVPSLQPSATYNWHVQAYNVYAYGAESEHRIFQTGSFVAQQTEASDSQPGGLSSWLRAAEGLLLRR
jgi:hypothetical protein